jgi:exoribonuclease II
LLKKKKINKEDLYCLDFITLNSNSTIKKFIDNILIQNQIETQQLKTILQLNSIEGIAVSLGLELLSSPRQPLKRDKTSNY